MSKALVWLRRDIRVQDHAALVEACKKYDEVLLTFVLDKNIIDKLPENDRRMTFIIESLNELNQTLQEKHESGIIIKYGDPAEEIPKLIKEHKISALFFNRDYESYALKRDQKIEQILNEVEVHTYRDHVTFEPHEVLKGDGNSYKVFTPYKNAWLDVFYTRLERASIKKPNLSKLCKIKLKSQNLYKLTEK